MEHVAGMSEAVIRHVSILRLHSGIEGPEALLIAEGPCAAQLRVEEDVPRGFLKRTKSSRGASS